MHLGEGAWKAQSACEVQPDRVLGKRKGTLWGAGTALGKEAERLKSSSPEGGPAKKAQGFLPPAMVVAWSLELGTAQRSKALGKSDTKVRKQSAVRERGE